MLFTLSDRVERSNETASSAERRVFRRIQTHAIGKHRRLHNTAVAINIDGCRISLERDIRVPGYVRETIFQRAIAFRSNDPVLHPHSVASSIVLIREKEITRWLVSQPTELAIDFSASNARVLCLLQFFLQLRCNLSGNPSLRRLEQTNRYQSRR